MKTYKTPTSEAVSLEANFEILGASLAIYNHDGRGLTNPEDYPEIFSTKGNQKRSAKNMAEVLATVKEELSR